MNMNGLMGIGGNSIVELERGLEALKAALGYTESQNWAAETKTIVDIIEKLKSRDITKATAKTLVNNIINNI